MDGQAPDALLYLFPLFFIAMWLGVTSLIGLLSGWFWLQRRFPDTGEPSLLTFRMRSGRMGLGVHMGGILWLSACPSGLRVGVLRLFGPFQRAFLVPWDEISVEPRLWFLFPSARLSFGRPEIGRLTIGARLWQRLAAEAPHSAVASALPHVSLGKAALGSLAVWLVLTALAATFFYNTTRTGVGPPLSLGTCLGFPALFFGFGLLVRFLREA